VVHTLLYLVKAQTLFRNRSCIVPSKEVSVEGQGLTAVEKYSIKNAVGTTQVKFYTQVQTYVEVNIVGSQDTTGLMTSQELESMAATVISPIVDGAYQSGCPCFSLG
jgi:aconitate hydratase 2/2-methylisocitrate dehydratase